MVGLYYLGAMKMTKDRLDSAIAQITADLQERNNNTITGALIGELIRKITPDLDLRRVMDMPTGTGVLSKFIERYLSDLLTRSHKQGSDWVYTIKSNSSTKQAEIDPDLWRNFVRPNSPRTLVIRDSTMVLDESPESPPELNEKLNRIQSATESELEQIQIDFANTLKENSASLLTIQDSYANWSIALRKMGGNIYSNWTEFRLRRLEELFSARLNALEIAPELNKELCNIMRSSQLAAKAALVTKKTQTSKNQAQSAAIKSQSMKLEVNLRSAIIEVIQNLSISDLREIKLPSGAIFDAIISQTKK